MMKITNYETYEHARSTQRQLQRLVPEGQGAVSLLIYPEGDISYRLELWGVLVAWTSSYTGTPHFNMDIDAVTNANPDWLEDVRSIVESLNHWLYVSGGKEKHLE